MNDQQHYTIVYPSQSIEGQPGWSAKTYDPIREEWVELGSWYSTQEAVLQEASVRFCELMRQNQVAEVLKPVIDDLRQKGFSLGEILDGLAELAHRDAYPTQVGYLLEEAARAAE